jgi:hypothetical protein
MVRLETKCFFQVGETAVSLVATQLSGAVSRGAMKIAMTKLLLLK